MKGINCCLESEAEINLAEEKMTWSIGNFLLSASLKSVEMFILSVSLSIINLGFRIFDVHECVKSKLIKKKKCSFSCSIVTRSISKNICSEFISMA